MSPVFALLRSLVVSACLLILLTLSVVAQDAPYMPQPEWDSYTDIAYGYTIQVPSGWYTETASGLRGSVSTLSSFDPAAPAELDNGVQIQIGVAIRVPGAVDSAQRVGGAAARFNGLYGSGFHSAERGD